MTKSRRPNAGNSVGIVVQMDGAAHNIGIGGKVTAPKAIADNHHRGATRYRILRTEQPSLLGHCAEDGKISGTGDEQLETLRPRSTSQIDAATAGGGHVFEHTGAILEIVHLGHGETDAVQSYPGIVVEDFHQTIGLT